MALWSYGPVAFGLNTKINAHCASAVYNIVLKFKTLRIHNNHVGYLSLLLPVRV